MPKLIPPSPGRVVWYYPSQQEIEAKSLAIYDQGQPLAATVAYVFSDRLVNLSVVDQAGAQFRRTSVKLLQEDDETPHTSEGPYATWMPYQLGQAEKAGETAGKFVDVSQYQGKAPEGAGIGTLSGGSLAAAQGFTGEGFAQQAQQLQASAPKVGEFVEAQKQLDAAAEGTAETKVYTDGTLATGTAPQPELSPSQQDAAANGAGDPQA